jgi:hypothetical protein
MKGRKLLEAAALLALSVWPLLAASFPEQGKGSVTFYAGISGFCIFLAILSVASWWRGLKRTAPQARQESQ